MKRLPKWSRVLIALSIVLALAWAFASWRMSRGDAAHARFIEAGATIKGMLSDFAGALKTAAKKGDTTDLDAFFDPGFSVPNRGSWVLGPPREVGGVSARDLVVAGDAPCDRDGIVAYWHGYLGEMEEVSRIKCKIDLIEALEPFASATLTVKFILDGRDGEGLIFQDRHFYRWQLVNGAESGDYYDWKIHGDGLVEGIRVIEDGTVFTALPPESLGVDYVHRRDPDLNVKEHGDEMLFGVIEHGIGGASTADFDRDGRPDVFFADGVESRLYRNITEPGGEIRFTDVTESMGLGGIGHATSGAFADFDNDGDADLLVTRYLKPNLYYERDGETFRERGAELGLDLIAPCIAITLLDHDRDGLLDIYLGVNGNAFEALPRLPFFSRNGQPNRLFRNTGDAGFVDVTERARVGDTGWTLAVAAGDFNDDGYPDIATANDFGRKNLYRNNGDGTFTEMAKEAGTLDFSGGMGILFADLDNDGLQDIYTSNIKSNTRWFGEDLTLDQYMRNVARTSYLFRDLSEYMAIYDLLGSDWTRLGLEVGEGNSLFVNNGDETFTELKDSHTNQAGWGWGIAALDYDNDTDLDLYAANGWITNTPDTDL